MQALPRKDSQEAPRTQSAPPHGLRADPAGRLEMQGERRKEKVSGGARSIAAPARSSAEPGVERSLPWPLMILRHRAKRTILFGRMLNRIVAIHGKRAPTMAQLRTREPQPMWGTSPQFCKLAAHHDWENAGRSEVLRAHQHSTQGSPHVMTKMKSLEDLFSTFSRICITPRSRS
jgi:hypothetical protein